MLGAMKPLSQAEPTYSHYALTHLLNKGLIHYIVSTNMDGLHRRSGTKAEQISELHGNWYVSFSSFSSSSSFIAFPRILILLQFLLISRVFLLFLLLPLADSPPQLP